MNLRQTTRFWNRFVLGVLVLLVTGWTLCTIADSAAAQGKASSVDSAGAP